MSTLEKKRYLLVGVSVAAVVFILLVVGIRLILGNEVNTQNIGGLIVFSLVTGVSAASLVFFELRIAFLFYIAGLGTGFIVMYQAFWNGMTGWGDLVGLVSLVMWVVIGLGTGLAVQLGYYLFRKFKK